MSIRSAPVIQELVLNSQDYVVVPDRIPSGLVRVLQLASMKMRFTQVVKQCQISVLVLFAVPFSAHDLARFPFCFPLLEDLSVVTSARTHIVTDGPGPGTFVVLDKLTRLRISSSEADFFPVCALTTPVLRLLEIEKDMDYFYLGEEGVVLEEYLRFIRRSQAPLDTFSFTSQGQSTTFSAHCFKGYRA